MSDTEIKEVCRKCQREYTYTMKQVDSGHVGKDVCRDCVDMRNKIRERDFSLDDLKMMMKMCKF